MERPDERGKGGGARIGAQAEQNAPDEESIRQMKDLNEPDVGREVEAEGSAHDLVEEVARGAVVGDGEPGGEKTLEVVERGGMGGPEDVVEVVGGEVAFVCATVGDPEKNGDGQEDGSRAEELHRRQSSRPV